MSVWAWFWIVSAIILLVFELIAFIDGAKGLPTASQLVKEWKRDWKYAKWIIRTALLLVGPVLWMHWDLEWF